MSTAAAPGRAAVAATEFRFDPSTLTTTSGKTTSGKTTFVVTNVGSLEHEFQIVRGDRTAELTGHEESGMKGMLIVTDQGQGGRAEVSLSR